MGYDGPMRTQTMVQLTDELVALLDQRADRDGTSRSQVIREAVETYLAEDREFDRDEWGDVGGLSTALTAGMLRSVADEEREAGDET